MKIVRNFSSGKIDEKVVGGKAKRLYKLQMAKFPVKEFIVISTDTVVSILKGGSVPRDVLNDILSFLNFGRHGVAVRSSAVGEDGHLSWAGQFTTRLFVSKNDLEKIITECIQAQHSKTVRAYAKVHKVEIPPLALIVQEMVDAETAGVLFTTSPINKSSEAVVEAIAGVGEALVSGLCKPVRFHINLETGNLLKVDGNRNEISLSDSQLAEIVFYGRAAIGLFSSHQDIEWAVERGTKNIFINQSRTITTVSNFNIDGIRATSIQEAKNLIEAESVRLDGLGISFGEDVLSDQNIAEILTPHPCQMAFGIFTYCFAHEDGAIKVGRNEMGYEIGSELNAGLFTLIGGQPRCSIVHDAMTFRIKGIALGDYTKIIEFYLAKIKQEEKLANYPEIVLYQQTPEREFLEGLFGIELGEKYYGLYQKFFSNLSTIEDGMDKYCRDEFIPRWRKSMALYAEAHLLSDLQMMARCYKEVADLLRIEACVMFVQAARIEFFVFARLRNLLKKMFGEQGGEFLNTITSGIPLNLNPNLAFSVRLSQFRDKAISIKDVLSEFGHLGIHELEISIPRYHEQPKIIAELAQKISGDPYEELMASIKRSSVLIERLLNDAAELRGELEREINIARRYLPLREVAKFEFLRGYDILRTISLTINKKLGWEDGLIFHLDPTEVFLLGSCDNENMRQLAEERRRKWNENKSLYIPTVVWSSELDAVGRPPTLNSSILYGIGVTNSTTEGEVIVITDLNNQGAISSLRPGGILVTITTDPAWTPLLSVIGSKGGLITEVGGLLAHAAIYTREVGMAAVLNVSRATQILKTGMRVRVNGPQGYVEILK